MFKELFKKYKVKTKILEERKDDVKVSQKEFFEKIDRARTSKRVNMTFQELEDFMLKKTSFGLRNP